MPDSNAIKICRINDDIVIERLDHPGWKKAPQTLVTKYWSGNPAPAGRQFTARLLWSATALYVRFEANQAEPLVVNETPNLRDKTIGLWDRDV